MARKIKKPITGYKVFDINGRKELSCRFHTFGGIKSAIKHHVLPDMPKLCKHGYHFCEELHNCFRYYNFDSKKHVVCEVRAHDNIDDSCSNKSATCNLEIVRVLTIDEINKVLIEQNPGKTATGKTKENLIVSTEWYWNGNRDVRRYFFYDNAWNKIPGISVPKALQKVANIDKKMPFLVQSTWIPVGHESRGNIKISENNVFSYKKTLCR